MATVGAGVIFAMAFDVAFAVGAFVAAGLGAGVAFIVFFGLALAGAGVVPAGLGAAVADDFERAALPHGEQPRALEHAYILCMDTDGEGSRRHT